MRATLFALVSSAVLAGCATVTVTETSRVDEKVGRKPELQIESSATVGSPIFSQFRYWSRTGYRLTNGVSTRIGLGNVFARDGEFIAPGQVEGETAYCTEALTYVDPMMGPHKTACFVDRDKDGRFEIVKAAPGMIWFESKLQQPTPYERGELVIPRPDAKNTEILYQGFTGNTLRLSYREYVNDLARPSYFQDVSYEIHSFPAEIAFKTVKLHVLNAGNNGITYRVLSGF